MVNEFRLGKHAVGSDKMREQVQGMGAQKAQTLSIVVIFLPHGQWLWALQDEEAACYQPACDRNHIPCFLLGKHRYHRCWGTFNS